MSIWRLSRQPEELAKHGPHSCEQRARRTCLHVLNGIAGNTFCPIITILRLRQNPEKLAKHGSQGFVSATVSDFSLKYDLKKRRSICNGNITS